MEDSVAEEDALAVAAHEAATAGWPPHGHIRTQSEFQAVFASVAEHLLTPPSIMALFGNDVVHRTGDLRSITVRHTRWVVNRKQHTTHATHACSVGGVKAAV